MEEVDKKKISPVKFSAPSSFELFKKYRKTDLWGGKQIGNDLKKEKERVRVCV